MAAGDFYINPGTPIVFKSTGGDITFDPSITAARGHVSDPCDLTTVQDAAGPGLYAWLAKVKKVSGTPVIGEAIDLYLGYSDKTNDFNISQVSADFVSANELKGATWIGQVLLNDTSVGPWVAAGEIFIPVPQVQAIWWNGTTTLTLSATAGDLQFTLTPLPYKKQ